MRALVVIALLASPAFAVDFANRNSVTSPAPYQVFQRSGTTCTIAVSGSVLDGANAHTIEANVDGGSFSTIQAGTSTTYSGSLTSVAQGVHTIRVRYNGTPQQYIDIPLVGCGDLFAIAGQSNAVGQANNNQFYSSSSVLDGVAPHAAIFGGDYTWRLLNDAVGFQSGWVDSVNNNSGLGNFGGSIWPLIASSFITSTGVPIGFIPCAKDSTSISQWLPGASHTDRTTLYGACVFRAQSVSSAVKGVLWWQGETDAVNATAGATYTSNLQTIADAFFADLGGAVLVPVKLQTASGYTSGNQATINTAISTAHTNDSTHIAAPADFSNLYADDAFHLKSDANLRSAADGSVTPAATVTLWSAIKTAFGYP